MASITLRNVSKAFGNVLAVDNVLLDIADGEIVCLLGPSGCGKTTTLRMIAGFEHPTAGEILIGGTVVSSPKVNIPPERRNLGMVFQNYAVWPHMTVFANIAYPLKLRRLPKRQIAERVMQAISLVGLAGLEKRYPEQLSGGQQQRVALARALVIAPAALLLDEPLSNLDAKLRERMRFELMDLHRQLHVTMVYVTHDQAEAMVLSDRVVVMNQGRVIQVDSPVAVYREPQDPFVADFIGVANFIPAVLKEEVDGQGIVELTGAKQVQFRCRVRPKPDRTPPAEGMLFVRPEDVVICAPGEGEAEGIVARVTFLGMRLDVRVNVAGIEWRIDASTDSNLPKGGKVGLRVRSGIFFDSKE